MARRPTKRGGHRRNGRRSAWSARGGRPLAPPLAQHRHNLPVQRTSFIGREKDIVKIKRLFTQTHLLTLTGTGGCGKTRLALRVAEDVLAKYRDGVWFVELAPLSDSHLVPEAVARVLSVRDQAGHGLQRAIVEHLRAKRLLIVMDNCEHVIETCALFVETLLGECPHVHLLATSREALSVAGETAWSVSPLPVPNPTHVRSMQKIAATPSVRLFIKRAKVGTPKFALTSSNAQAVAEVCRRLDGLPLAIELAAARVKVLTVDQILERLDDRFRLLTASGRTTIPRHQTLRAAIDWSFNLLTEQEQALFRRLSVFAGGWTIEAAESICSGGNVSVNGVLNTLTSLVDKSLVIVEPHGTEARYRLLETIRQYGRDRLAESQETTFIRNRHRAWYRDFAELAEPKLRTGEQDHWVARLENEHDNLREALTWSVDASHEATGRSTADADFALRFVVALWWFWFARGHFGEGRRWLEQVLASSGRGATALRARALMAKGVLTFMQGDLSGGTLLLEESVRLSEACIDHRGIAWATGWLGVPAVYGGHNDRAVEHYQRSLALWRNLEDPWGIAWMAVGLGSALAARGETERAISLFDEAITLCRKVGDKWATALALHYSAYWAIARGDVERIAPLVEESLSLFRALGARREIPRALGNLGLIALERCDYGPAATWFRESLALFREVGDKRGIALCFERLARVAGAQRRLVLAARLLGASEAAQRAIGVVSTARSAVYEFGGLEHREAVRVRLGGQLYEQALAEGRAMTPEQAVDYALAFKDSGESTLRDLGVRVVDGGPLTSREFEIAQLVANGLTNREIAATLVVSRRTADSHVRNILGKLRFRSRAQIAAWVTERGGRNSANVQAIGAHPVASRARPT